MNCKATNDKEQGEKMQPPSIPQITVSKFDPLSYLCNPHLRIFFITIIIIK